MYSSPTGRRGRGVDKPLGEAATTDSHTAHGRPTVPCGMPRKGTTTPWILARTYLDPIFGGPFSQSQTERSRPRCSKQLYTAEN